MKLYHTINPNTTIDAFPNCFFSVTKAAAISSAMLARKSSYHKGRESLGLLADLLGDEQQEATDTSKNNIMIYLVDVSSVPLMSDVHI